MDSAAPTCPSVKCWVRRTAGMVIPAAPTRYWAAGLFAYSSAGFPPGTTAAGASGTTVLASGSAPPPGTGTYGLRRPM
ncbi:hypothetical protein GCM10020254_55730 [Streptomyces goshikiensis]